jgi:hypothetical protein
MAVRNFVNLRWRAIPLLDERAEAVDPGGA